MPDKSTIKRAQRDARQGKSPSTQAGEFVRDEIRKVRKGKHGVRSSKQAIAIALSEARRSGVKLPPPRKGSTSPAVRERAKRDLKKGRNATKPSAKRSRATLDALKKEPRRTVSKAALSRQAKTAARKRSAAERSRSAKKAAETRAQRKAA
jgi:hypothetical protein